MPTALVTGGAGFIGSHLVNRLILDGYRVYIVDFNRIFDAHPNISQQFHFDIADVARLTWAWSVPRVDIVFHLAAVSRTPPAISDPVRCFQTNVTGSLNVLEYARLYKVPRVVLSSSNVVYAAETPYKASKLSMEHWAAAYTAMYGVSTICLRYSNVYGPGLKKGDLACLASLRDSAKDRGYIEITGDGEQSRDFTHVSDIVEGNMLAARSDVTGNVDLCTGVNTTMNQVALKSEAQLNGGVNFIFSNQFMCPIHYIPDRHGDIKHIVQDSAPAKALLSWQSKIKFEEGIHDIFTY